VEELAGTWRILRDNLLQCLICIVIIDLSRVCDSSVVLIYKSLVLNLNYLKMLLFPTSITLIYCEKQCW
jgi:hypothetical protein